MDLSTNFMGLKLANPLIVSSSGLTNSVNKVRKIAENGAGAVVLKSLFEEQIIADRHKLETQTDMYFWYPDAVEFVNNFTKDQGIEAYLDLIKGCKDSVDIPVIASINCITPKEWPVFAEKIEEAGADGLELNISIMPFGKEIESHDIENSYYNIVKEVKKYLDIPVSVKLSFYFSNIYLTVKRLHDAGAKGVVLFNRFYRPDVDVNNLSLATRNVFSSHDEITLSLRWIGLLSKKIGIDFAGNTGIHSGADIVKQILVGASSAQVCTAIYRHGFEFIGVMLDEMVAWMRKFGYSNLDQFRGLLSKDDEATAEFERVQFMKRAAGKFE